MSAARVGGEVNLHRFHAGGTVVEGLHEGERAVVLQDTDLQSVVQLGLPHKHLHFQGVHWDFGSDCRHSVNAAVPDCQAVVAAVGEVVPVVQLRFAFLRHGHILVHELPAIGLNAS